MNPPIARRQMRQRVRVLHATMPGMTQDAHAQANVEQVRVLREALAATEPAVETAAPAQEGDPEPSGTTPPMR